MLIIRFVHFIKEFHNKFHYKVERIGRYLLRKKDYELRYNLAKEELDEYLEACQTGDEVEIADALTDQFYILIGTFEAHGFTPDQITKLFLSVHASNMSKLDDNGNAIIREDGKILKGKNYFPPTEDIKRVLYGS
jgi:predicted HAD superfamily Cof-like phosphohydrolase